MKRPTKRCIICQLHSLKMFWNLKMPKNVELLLHVFLEDLVKKMLITYLHDEAICFMADFWHQKESL